MKNNLIGIVFAVTISIVIIGSVAAPFIKDFQSGNVTTLTNETVGDYVEGGSDDYVVVSNPAYVAFTINGETVDFTPVIGRPVLITDKCLVYANGHYFQLFNDVGVRVSNISTSNYMVEYSYDAATETFTYTTYDDLIGTNVVGTFSYNVEKILYYLPGGDYGINDTATSYYVNEFSQVITTGAHTAGNLDTSYLTEGSTVYLGSGSYTASATSTISAHSSIKGINVCSDISINVSDGVNTESFTPSYIFIPKEVSGVTSSQSAINSLFGIILLVTITGVICAFAYAIMKGRDY